MPLKQFARSAERQKYHVAEKDTFSMPTRSLVERRNWIRLPVSLPAIFTTVGDERQTLHGEILNLSEAGVGFTLNENIQSLHEITVSFWLPLDVLHPDAAMVEPIAVRLTLVSSRYVENFKTYAYGGVFFGLKAPSRHKIRRHLRRTSLGV